jgi:disulfide oxidoreductase YuzD
MVTVARVAIIGAPVSCGDEVKDTWRELARWVAAQLRRRYGDSVQVEYHDLFDPECPPLPPDAQLPLVMVNGEVLTSGGKLSLPLIRRAVDAAGAMRGEPDRTPISEGDVSARATAERASGTSR